MIGKSGLLLAAMMFEAALLAGSADAAQTLKLNESLGPGSPEETALNAFKQAVEDGSKGELKIQLYFQDALGNPQTSTENLMTGSLDLYSGALEYYEPLAREEFSVISMPYLVGTHENLRRYLASPVFAAAEQKLLARGIRFLETSAERGPYRVLVTTKPVLKVEDLDGLKLRMFPNEIAIRSWTNLGAVPLQIAWTQTYLALRQGTVQGVTAPMSTVRSVKFTEVAPYITAIKEYPQVWPITISERVWQKLKPADQKLLTDAAASAAKLYTEVTRQHAEQDVDLMIRENSAVFIELNTAPFRKKMEPLYQQLIKEGALSQAVYDTVSALTKQP
ncbi:MAG: TRAP transporter substrate-binding protein [Pseudomonadota bacterium]